MAKRSIPWDIQKYLNAIFVPTMVTGIAILSADLLSLISAFSFLVGGVFSLFLWLVKIVAAASIGIKVNQAGGRIVNAFVAALLFGAIAGIVDIVGQLIYTLVTPPGGFFHLTTISLIFLPINLAIFASIVSIIAYIISQKD